MEWKIRENIPIKVKEFIDDISETLMLPTRDLRVILCSFAEKEKTCNECVCTNQDNIYEELFKISPYNFICPDNLIIRIIEKCNRKDILGGNDSVNDDDTIGKISTILK